MSFSPYARFEYKVFQFFIALLWSGSNIELLVWSIDYFIQTLLCRLYSLTALFSSLTSEGLFVQSIKYRLRTMRYSFSMPQLILCERVRLCVYVNSSSRTALNLLQVLSHQLCLFHSIFTHCIDDAGSNCAMQSHCIPPDYYLSAATPYRNEI